MQTLEKQKPAVTSSGPGTGAKTNHQLNPIIAPKSPNVNRPGALGRLLDQALARWSDHQERAAYFQDLADYHAGQALAHKAILSELQKLIPGGHHAQR